MSNKTNDNFDIAASSITITEAACAHIKKFLDPAHKKAGFKLSVKKSGCSGYAYLADIAEQPTENDICTEKNGIQLFIDKASLPFLKGTTIDLIDKGLYQKQLYFDNPNVEDSCGCGESFTVKT